MLNFEESIMQAPPALCVIVRLESNPRIAQFIDRIRNLGTRIVFDIDDVVFHGNKGEDGYIPLMRQADALTGTTTALVNEETELKKHCYKIPNSVSRSLEAIAANLKEVHLNETVRVGYFPGTATHNRDFLELAEQLYRMLRSNLRMKFVLVGHLDLPDYYSTLPEGQIERYPFQDPMGYFRLLSICDVNLIPLEVNRFNHCKSELKLFEAAALSIPSVVSPTEPHLECVRNWENGVIAYAYEDWTDSLTRLIADRRLREDLGKAARATIGEQFSYRTVGPIADGVYRSILSLEKSKDGQGQGM